MSLVGFSARNHPQQRTNPAVDDRGTDPSLFAELDARFGFTLDACALPHNAKCERFFSPTDDGLACSWSGARVWCNPPYSNIRPWVEKSWDAWVNGGAELVVMLLPANRTEQAWWQDCIEPARDGRRNTDMRVEFLRGRPRFVNVGKAGIGPNERPPFGCCLVIFERVTS